MSKPWIIGNTTIRNPARLKEGLEAFYRSPVYGLVITGERELQLARSLANEGVINAGGTSLGEYGRKWRSAFSQLGLITHRFTRTTLSENDVDPVIVEALQHQEVQGIDLSGKPHEITPNGMRIINATSVRQHQECMLRAVLAYQIPSPIENRWNQEESLHPLKFVLQILKKLDELNVQPGLSVTEIAIVQSYTRHDLIDQVMNEIFEYRRVRNDAGGLLAKRSVDSELYERKGLEAEIKASSIYDYADANYRYLRFTGLFSLQGKRIIINVDKKALIDWIIDNNDLILDRELQQEYLTRLWNGAELPTDDNVGARREIDRVIELIGNYGVQSNELPAITDEMPIAELTQLRIRVEEMLKDLREQEYASLQREQILEIIAYLKYLDRQNTGEIEINIRNDERPTYLEWTVWRAFLAINSLVNKPYESRRFQVDDDFLPISFAPSGGPDMIFEFDDFVLVVEVTLTTSSRQEAAEGEPVRRHIAKEKEKVSEQSGKAVYGLFLARTIDNNTAETFRIGIWYNGDEVDFLNIVPIKINDLIEIMEKLNDNPFTPSDLRRLVENCLIPRNAHAPLWKREISKLIEQFNQR